MIKIYFNILRKKMELNSLGEDLLTLILYYGCHKKSIFMFHESSVSLSLVCKEWLRVIKGDKFKFLSMRELNFVLSDKHPLRIKKDCHYNFIWREYVGKYSLPSGSLILEISCKIRNENFRFQNVPVAVELGEYLIIHNYEFLTIFYKNMTNIIYKARIDMFQMGSYNSIGHVLEVSEGFITFVFLPILPEGIYIATKVNFKTFGIQQKPLNIHMCQCGYFGVYFNVDGHLMRINWEEMFSSELDDANLRKKAGRHISDKRYKYIFPCSNIDIIISESQMYAIGTGEEILWSSPLMFPNAEYRAKRYGNILCIACNQLRFLMDPWSGKIICSSESIYLEHIISITLDLDMLGYTVHLRDE